MPFSLSKIVIFPQLLLLSSSPRRLGGKLHKLDCGRNKENYTTLHYSVYSDNTTLLSQYNTIHPTTLLYFTLNYTTLLRTKLHRHPIKGRWRRKASPRQWGFYRRVSWSLEALQGLSPPRPVRRPRWGRTVDSCTSMVNNKPGYGVFWKVWDINDYI